MKAIILSAGNGTRLLPLTREVPKCLVRVGERAILDEQLAALADAGLAEAVVITGYRAPQVAEHLAERPQPLRVTTIFNPFWSIASSIGSVWAARSFLDAPFCLLNGDTVFDRAILADAFGRAGQDISLLVEPIETPDADDMLVAVTNDRVLAVSKRLPAAEVRHRSLGVILSRGGGRYAAALDTVIAEPGGTGAFHHAIVDRLAHSGVVTAVEARGLWCEIDRPEDIERWEAARIRA